MKNNMNREELEKLMMKAMHNYSEYVAVNIKNYEDIPSSEAFYNVIGDDLGEKVGICNAILDEYPKVSFEDLLDKHRKQRAIKKTTR